MIFPVPGSMAVPLIITVVPGGVANAVEARAAARAKSERRFILMMSSKRRCLFYQIIREIGSTRYCQSGTNHLAPHQNPLLREKRFLLSRALLQKESLAS